MTKSKVVQVCELSTHVLKIEIILQTLLQFMIFKLKLLLDFLRIIV